MKRNKGLIKRRVAILLVVCLTVGTLTLPVLADEANTEKTGKLFKTELDTKEDVFDVDKKEPVDYVKDGATPSGLTKDQDVQIIQANELITLESTQESGHLNKMKTKAYDQITDKVAIPSYDYTVDDGVMIDSVAFDPTHTGKKDHLAVMTLKETSSSDFDVYLNIYDLADMSLLKSQKLTTLDSKYFYMGFDVESPTLFDDLAVRANQFIQVKAASFDGQYDDCLVASVMPEWGFYNMAQKGKEKDAINIFRCTVENKTCTLTTYRTLSYGQCFANLTNFDAFPMEKDRNSFRFQVGVTCGDFDRDTIDEIGLTFSIFQISESPAFQHTTSLSPEKTGNGYRAEDYTTEVVVLDNISTTKEPEKAFDELLLQDGQWDADNDKYIATHAAVCAAGDVDANRAEDLIIGGRTLNITLSKDHQTSCMIGNGGPIQWIVSYNGDAGYSIRTSNTLSGIGYAMSFSPIALETAAAEGLNKPCTIFFNGHLFQYDEAKNALIERTDDVYSLCKNFQAPSIKLEIRKVVKGNFTNDENGRESFAFDCVLCKHDTQHGKGLFSSLDYIGYMYPEFEGGTDFVTGWGNNSLDVDEITKDNAAFYPGNQDSSDLSTYKPFLMVSTDIDDDGLRVQYVGTEYMYTDPRVMAVLEAPPKFKELGGSYVFTGGSTDYTKITGHSHTSEHGFSKTQEYGISVSAKFTIKKVVSIEPKVYGGYTHGSSEKWGDTRVDTATQGFSTSTTDTVVVQRRPIACYKYHVWDPETKDWLKDDQGNYYEEATLIYLNPCLFNLSVDEYNEFVDEYNDRIKKNNKDNTDDLVYLKRIKTGKDGELDKDAVLALPLNSQDNPANYFSGSEAGEVPIKVKEATAHSLSHDGSAQSFDLHTEETSYKEESFYNGAHESVSVSVGCKFLEWLEGSVTPEVNFSQTWDNSSIEADIRGYSYSAKVEGVNPLNYMKYNWNAAKQYGFDWQFATWETVLDTQTDENGKPANIIPVLGYKVTNVNYPGQAPYNLLAKTEDGKVTLTWNKPKDIREGSVLSPTNRTKFKIYRSTIQDEIYIEDGDLTYVGEVDANTTSFTEPLSNLEKGKQHNYFVSAVYGDEGDQKTYEAFSRAEIRNYIITAASTVQKMKEQIKTFKDNGDDQDQEKIKALLDAYDMMAQNPEIRAQMEADEELQAWISGLRAKLKDSSQKEETTQKEEVKPASNKVATGDAENIALWIIVGIMAMAAGYVMKKNNQ